MKGFFIFGFGVILGIAGTKAIEKPKEVGKVIRSSVDTAEDVVEHYNYNQCRKNYLEQTSCYQNKEAKVCDNEISKRCLKDTYAGKGAAH